MDWRYWFLASGSSVLLGIIWNLEPADLKSIKKDWAGLFGTLILVGLPCYFHQDWLQRQALLLTPLSLIPLVTFFATVALLYFWHPKGFSVRVNYEKSWDMLIARFRKSADRKGILLEPPLSQYQFAFASSARRLIDNESYEVFIWMILVSIGIWGFYFQ